MYLQFFFTDENENWKWNQVQYYLILYPHSPPLKNTSQSTDKAKGGHFLHLHAES